MADLSLRSQITLGGIISAFSLPRICLRADEVNICWSLARIESMNDRIGMLPGVARSTPHRAGEHGGHTTRVCFRQNRARRKSLDNGVANDEVRGFAHVSSETVTCGVTVALFGVLGLCWNDCTVGPRFCSASNMLIGSGYGKVAPQWS